MPQKEMYKAQADQGASADGQADAGASAGETNDEDVEDVDFESEVTLYIFCSYNNNKRTVSSAFLYFSKLYG